ncbi:hypothetical protein AwPolaro_00910 [Polaromonas sp.]|nr:hypothetical protein AwPolaro_00910 [Polaromonas sp.]
MGFVDYKLHVFVQAVLAQLPCYHQPALSDKLKSEHDAPTIGLVLCKSKRRHRAVGVHRYCVIGASAKANALGMRAMQERTYAKRSEQYLLIKNSINDSF